MDGSPNCRPRGLGMETAWAFAPCPMLTHVKRAVRLRPVQSKILKSRKQETGMK